MQNLLTTALTRGKDNHKTFLGFIAKIGYHGQTICSELVQRILSPTDI